MIYSFDEEVAKAVGVEAAVILDKFAWWIRHNESNGKNLHEGKYWTFNSTKAMEKMFPFFNMWKIGRITKKLVDDGYLITGNFNKLPFDRTLWYTLSEKGEQLMKCACHDFAESQSDALQNCKMTSSENAQPIPVPTNVKKQFSNIYMQFAQKFNEKCVSLPKVRTKGSATRIKTVKARFKDLDEDWNKVDMFLNKVAYSDFLSGKTGWNHCSFDWIIKESNFTKIMEGNYDNKSSTYSNNNGFDDGVEVRWT